MPGAIAMREVAATVMESAVAAICGHLRVLSKHLARVDQCPAQARGGRVALGGVVQGASGDDVIGGDVERACSVHDAGQPSSS